MVTFFYFILYTVLMFVQSKYVYDYTYNISIGVCLGDVHGLDVDQGLACVGVELKNLR